MLGKNLAVTLTLGEMQAAAAIGVARQLEAKKAGLKDRHGFEGAGWDVHIEGAAGELAFAKASNRYWCCGVNTFKDADLGEKIQIRTRAGGIRTDLIVRNDDKPDDIFVLVTGRAPDFVVHGWTLGGIAKNRKYVQSYGGRVPAYFMPPEDLMPFPIRLPGPPSTDYF